MTQSALPALLQERASQGPHATAYTSEGEVFIVGGAVRPRVALGVSRRRRCRPRETGDAGPAAAPGRFAVGRGSPAAVTAPATQATFGGGADPFSQILNGAMPVLSQGKG
jgi:hypothetical protein